jgi:hypothetical protein
MDGLRERVRETEERDDRWGPRVRERENAHARARAMLGRARCWAERAQARAGERGHERAALLG